MQAVYMAIPQVENMRRSMNTASGMRKALKEGRFMGKAPLGYRNSRDVNNRPVIEVVPEKASLVREAFELFATGMYDKEELRRKLKPKGLTLTKTCFAQMLRQPAYCGKIVVKAKDNEPELTVTAIHEPIIDETLYNKVQEQLKRRVKRKAKPKKLVAELPLRGNLICPDCGGNLTGSASKGSGGVYQYYHCQSPCRVRFRADVAHLHFEQWLRSLNIPSEIVALYLAILEDEFNALEKDRFKEIQVLKLQRDEKDKLLTEAALKLLKGEISYEILSRVDTSLRQEINALSMRIHDLEVQESGFKHYMRYGMTLLSDLSGYYTSAELDVKQKLVSSIFGGKLVYQNGNYRTNGQSEVMSLIANSKALLGGKKRGSSSEKAEEVGKVALPGIEPGSKV
ncbi:recombinase family protein [Pontibacter sp. SD6]|uniref:Recombinase family protein n=2 Tax=Pontibacter cellulosilyticus TaxID=1720253 RepID=A0A923N530_9BACT|nr:recombinase family protein [Pontibacter cellulosilyticus]